MQPIRRSTASPLDAIRGLFGRNNRGDSETTPERRWSLVDVSEPNKGEERVGHLRNAEKRHRVIAFDGDFVQPFLELQLELNVKPENVVS